MNEESTELDDVLEEIKYNTTGDMYVAQSVTALAILIVEIRALRKLMEEQKK